MNADGTVKHQEQTTSVVKENFRHRKKMHEFNLFKRYHDCDCKNCWKNFGLTTVFYAIIIYLLYLIVKFIFSLIDKKM